MFFFVFIVPPTEPVRFGSGFAGFRFLKPKPNRTEFFFKNFNRFNRFFFTVRFFWLFLSRFSRFNQFLGFFAHPYLAYIDMYQTSDDIIGTDKST